MPCAERSQPPSRRRRKPAAAVFFVAVLVALAAWPSSPPQAPQPSAFVAGPAAGSSAASSLTRPVRWPTVRAATPAAQEVPRAAVPAPPRSTLVQAWGALGVVGYLYYGIRKVVPIVTEGLALVESGPQKAFLAATLAFFAFVEGYRGFQQGFSPRVVSRAFVVSEQSEKAPFWHKLLAPVFCIGYFHGTRKRVISSWAVTLIIACVVAAVKRLDNPYRAILDAGVIVGLLWGMASIVLLFGRQLVSGAPPAFDPGLPEDSVYTQL